MRRRAFLIGAAASAGGLAVGYWAWSRSFAARAAALVEGPGESLLAGWIKIGGDGGVTVYVPHLDMGQGSHTALAMMAAEELDADWALVRSERAPGDRAFANRFLAQGWVLQGFEVPGFLDGAVEAGFTEAARFVDLQITGGSTAVRFTGQAGLRLVGAAARQLLLQAAAQRWGVAVQALTTEPGVVLHSASGRRAGYGMLAAAAAGRSVDGRPRLKPREAWRLIGRSPPRLDIPAKVDGSFAYGIDFTLPGLLLAAIRSAPVHGGRLLALDPAPALARPGVERVVALDDAIAVVADRWWQAEQALRALAPVFDDGGAGAVATRDLSAAQDVAIAAESRSRRLFASGNAAAVLRGAPESRRLSARYRLPFLHHAALEPICLTARYAEGRLEVWGGEQDALGTKARLMAISGLGASAVVFHGLAAGGAFGRRTAESADYLEPLVRLAFELAPRPVKLLRSREEDFARGAYRPLLTTRIEAALDAEGLPAAWRQVFVDSPTRNEAFALPYPVPNQEILSVAAPHHLRTGTWRSVAHTQHGFWTECFLDELAERAGRDPFDYRRSLLAARPRARRVLEAAAERAGWGGSLPPGVGRGIALVESYGTIVAEVVEASLGAAGRPRVHRVVAAVDCGEVVHPDSATQQVEGSIVMGLSAALGEQVTLEGGAVAETNFPAYPLLTLAETPEIEVQFLRSDGAWGGLGEPALPPVAPALANALFAASGRRFRELPIPAEPIV